MIRYDEALPRFAALLSVVMEKKDLSDQVFLRDAVGRLTLVVRQPLSEQAQSRLLDGTKELQPWVDPIFPFASPQELFDDALAVVSPGFPEFIDSVYFTGYVQLVERRIVGQDWLRSPQEPLPDVPPVIVFASHKGGVGRSTALALSAISLSRDSYNVLVVDLDLEAPGLGSLLLADPPQYGSLDYFVETGLGEVDDAFLNKLFTPSTFMGDGLIHVVPAVGAASERSPQNIIGKIARSYIERLDETGQLISLLDRTRQLIARLCTLTRYDAIFIDSRAGLNEATAAAVLGLGAEILLFGVDTPQTFAGYRYLLGHLQRFRPTTSGENDWRFRLRMVQAKTQNDPGSEENFRNNAYELFADMIYDEETGIEAEAFNFDYDDRNAPHYAWPIGDDANFAEFNPLVKRDQLSKHLYERAFGPFIANLRMKIGLPL